MVFKRKEYDVCTLEKKVVKPQKKIVLLSWEIMYRRKCITVLNIRVSIV